MLDYDFNIIDNYALNRDFYNPSPDYSSFSRSYELVSFASGDYKECC